MLRVSYKFIFKETYSQTAESSFSYLTSWIKPAIFTVYRTKKSQMVIYNNSKRKKFKFPQPPKFSVFQIIFFVLGVINGSSTQLVDPNSTPLIQVLSYLDSRIISSIVILVIFTGLEIMYYQVTNGKAVDEYKQRQLNTIIEFIIYGLGLCLGMLVSKYQVQHIYVICSLINGILIFTMPKYMVNKYYSK
jgi:hypothetical protein